MKDQYIGDVSDYFKYSLLRRVQSAGAEIVVCWMLTEADGKSDGSRRTYLNDREKFRPVDPEVFDLLADIDLEGGHSVSAIEASGILRGARCISEIVPDDAKLRYEYFWRTEEVASGGRSSFSIRTMALRSPARSLATRTRASSSTSTNSPSWPARDAR